MKRKTKFWYELSTDAKERISNLIEADDWKGAFDYIERKINEAVVEELGRQRAEKAEH